MIAEHVYLEVVIITDQSRIEPLTREARLVVATIFSTATCTGSVHTHYRLTEQATGTTTFIFGNSTATIGLGRPRLPIVMKS